MAESAPTASNPDSFPKGLDIYESFDQVTTGNIRKKTTPIGVTEEGVRVPLTDEHILHSYGYGPEDLPPKAAKKNKLWAKPIEVVDASEETAEESPQEKLVPADDFKDKHSVETEDGFPMKGVWEGPNGDQPVTVEKSYGIGGDGKIYYKIAESETGIPADQLKFYVSETTPTEPVEAETPTTDEAETLTSKVETEKSAEKLRREAINPERILELKDRFDREYSKELELHNIKTEEDKKKDPWLVESSAEHVRNKILREYLKIAETDWDSEELAEIREDVINMMKMSQRSLENLMLKPESEEPADGWPTPRTTVEPGPTPVEPAPTIIKPEPTAVKPGPEAPADGKTSETVTDEKEQKKGILTRLRNKFRNGRTRMHTIIYEGLTDKEKIKKRRWVIIGLMGASAVAGALGGILGYEAWEHAHHHTGFGAEPGNDDIDKHLNNIDKDIHHLEQQQQQHNANMTEQHQELSQQHHDLDEDLKAHDAHPGSESGGQGGESAPGAGGANEDYSQYQYPWDWADKKFGESNSMPQLHHLAEVAQQHGHKVEWSPGTGIEEDGSRAQILSIDGTTDTATVIKILNGYVNAG